jgi:hypothetical protein
VEQQEYITDYLKDVIGVVEANSFERQCLWEHYHLDLGWTWESAGGGPLVTVGHLVTVYPNRKHPICVELLWTKVNGHKILFYADTSMTVDHEMVKGWLEKNLPRSAFKESSPYPNCTDAMNFSNIFPCATELEYEEVV